MEDFSAIPVFVNVVEQGGFSAAARQMGLTKSAVSKRINQLESRLGVQLLHRTTRRISLTEAGEAYYQYASQSLTAAQEAEDAVTQMQGQPLGLLRINAPMSFGRMHMAPLVAEFLQRYPGLRLDLVMDDRRVDLIEGGFDLAVRAGTLTDSSLIARKLAPCANLIAASPTYINQFGAPRSPAGLKEHNCLSYAYFSGQQEWTFISPAGPEKIQVDGRFQANNGEALREAALGGLGIARFPSFMIAEEIASGALIRLLPDYDMPEQAFYLVYPERRHLPAKVRVFVDFMLEKFQSRDPYWQVMPT